MTLTNWQGWSDPKRSDEPRKLNLGRAVIVSIRPKSIWIRADGRDGAVCIPTQFHPMWTKYGGTVTTSVVAINDVVSAVEIPHWLYKAKVAEFNAFPRVELKKP